MNTTKDFPVENVPVLIVGGSLVGLSTSLFLSWHGIPSLLVERHPDTLVHPRFTGMTARTMEMYHRVGIEPAIRAVEPSLSLENSDLVIMESLAGKQIDRLTEDMRSYVIETSPRKGSFIAQDVLEPVLRAQSEKLGGDLRFGTELLAFEQDEEGITATVHERSTNITRMIRARYLVAADGHRSVIRQQLGITRHGAMIERSMSMVFEADLLPLFQERHVFVGIVHNETIPFGYLIPYPGSSIRPDLFRFEDLSAREHETEADYPEERCLSLIRAAVGIPDLQVKLKTVVPWLLNAYVADRFQQGRVFLVGDAARVQPPTGALGGNTGITEAYNLAWKLAAVIRGEAGPALLATYDQERRPIADLTVEKIALLSQQRHHLQADALTVSPSTVNMGYRYAQGALLPEHDEALPLVQDPLRWRGEPGTHAPHIVLTRAGSPISTLDLFGRQWVLLLGPDAQSWQETARKAAQQLTIPLNIYQIGSDVVDVNESFCAAYGVSATGAVLVRPDGFVAWRANDKNEMSGLAFRQLFSQLFYR